jgi:hypothetical protein
VLDENPMTDFACEQKKCSKSARDKSGPNLDKSLNHILSLGD